MTNISRQTLRQMQIMAHKLRDNPSYMAWVVTTYEKQEKITRSKFIEIMEIDEELLARLSLCRRPETNLADFASQVKKISEYTKVNAQKLANLIRQVESVLSLSTKPEINYKSVKNPAHLGLSAARDRTNDDSEQEGNGDDLA